MKKYPRKLTLVIATILILLIGSIGYMSWRLYVNQQTTNLQSQTSQNNIATSLPQQQSKVDAISLTTDERIPTAQPTPQTTPQSSVAATPGVASGSFIQQQGSKWPTPQTTIYIGISVNNAHAVSKVEWYLHDFSGLPLHVATKPSASDANDQGALYQFDWDVSNLTPGAYRVTGKVYDTNGNYQVITNNLGNPYLDTTIKS